MLFTATTLILLVLKHRKVRAIHLAATWTIGKERSSRVVIFVCCQVSFHQVHFVALFLVYMKLLQIARLCRRTPSSCRNADLLLMIIFNQSQKILKGLRFGRLYLIDFRVVSGVSDSVLILPSFLPPLLGIFFLLPP